MRWSYLIPRLILVFILWSAVAFGLDPLLRYSATESVQTATGAKADIGELTTELFPPAITIDGSEIANASRPGTNLLEFEQLQMSLDGDALLRKNFVVEEARLTGVRFGTSRDDNGQLDRIVEDEESSEPSWIAEKLKNIGDEWLDELVEQARGQVDPNQLETYRTGKELHVKWDARLDELKLRVDLLKTQADGLKQQMDVAKRARPVDQIQLYLQIAQNGDLLLQNAQRLRVDVVGLTPEVQTDFARLDQARQNDQQRATQMIRLLKPDARRISESLIGEQMYLQLQQLLTWVESAKEYQQELKQQSRPERHRGHDFDFDLFEPSPRFLCRKVLVSGELMLNDQATPFVATISDVTNDPKLLGRPAEMELRSAGLNPIQLLVRYDATQDVPATDVAFQYSDSESKPINAGSSDKALLSGSLVNQKWTAQLRLIEEQLTGRIQLQSDLGSTSLTTDMTGGSYLSQAVADMTADISEVTASIAVNGSLTAPEIQVSSDLGPKLAAGFEQALVVQASQLKQQLVATIDQEVDKQRSRLVSELGTRYQKLLNDNDKVIAGIQQARQLVASLQSGRLDAGQVFRQVSESGVLSDKDARKVDEATKVLDGLRNPNRALQQAMPDLRRKLFR